MVIKKQRQRRNGQGSVRARDKAGKVWQLVYTTVPGSGKERRQAYETFHGTRQQAEQRLRTLLGLVDSGSHVSPSKETVAEFMEYWMQHYAEAETTQRTQYGYRGDLNRYILPALGHLQLKSVAVSHIQEMLRDMRNKGLSGNTQRHAYVLINQALKHAVEWGRLEHNPCAKIKPPKFPHKQMRSLDEAGVRTFFDSISDSPYADIYRVDFYTGARRSEILAPRWPEVDLDGRSISIVAGLHRLKGQGLMLMDTKTDHSRRRIPIPHPVVDILRSIRGRQIELAELTLGQRWNAEGYVFCKADGSPMSPDAVTHSFTYLMREAGLNGISMHSLHHSCASLLLSQGENPKVVQELLGHSLPSTTLNIYSHTLPGVKDVAVDAFAERFSDSYNHA